MKKKQQYKDKSKNHGVFRDDSETEKDKVSHQQVSVNRIGIDSILPIPYTPKY